MENEPTANDDAHDVDKPAGDPDQSPTPAESGAADAALLELAMRLVEARYSNGESDQQPRLLVGQLPPNLPVELPIPDGARLLGTLLMETPTIVVDTSASPQDTFDFYRDRLAALGWDEQQSYGPMRGGFVHSSMMDRCFGNFFYGDEGPGLNIMTSRAAEGRTTIQLHYHADQMALSGGRHEQPMDRMQGLPPILPPSRSNQQTEGGGSGGDRAHATASLMTKLDLPALAHHYIEQLERAGWERRDAGVNGPVAWSAWAFAGEDSMPMRGLFVALKLPVIEDRYFLTLRVERADGSRSQSGGSGWTTFGSMRRRS